ncbi:hypothetical protein H1C71_011795 [Ictidomys tridecemlineatus]|nr:hypothetical protein H1C71_011795 [Ictidomys tridecemlineatus]
MESYVLNPHLRIASASPRSVLWSLSLLRALEQGCLHLHLHLLSSPSRAPQALCCYKGALILCRESGPRAPKETVPLGRSERKVISQAVADVQDGVAGSAPAVKAWSANRQPSSGPGRPQ